MEGSENQPQEIQNPSPQAESGDYSNRTSEKKKFNIWIPIGILLVVLAIAGGWFLLQEPKSSLSSTPSPSPISEIPTPTATPQPSPTDKTLIKLEVLNGTGISGEAAYLQGVLRTLGYTDVKLGNSSAQNLTKTTITFLSTTPEVVKNELEAKLTEIYKDVGTETGTTGTSIKIVTGLRKGMTPKPLDTATPKPTGSPLGTTGSPTPTATPTKSPSPTPTTL